MIATQGGFLNLLEYVLCGFFSCRCFYIARLSTVKLFYQSFYFNVVLIYGIQPSCLEYMNNIIIYTENALVVFVLRLEPFLKCLKW